MTIVGSTGLRPSARQSGIADRSDELAGRRILRRMSVFIAVGYAAYAAESIAPIFEASSVMATWWTATAAVLIFGTGLAMAPMAWRADLTRLRVAAFAAAAGYAIALGLWWFGWNGERLDAIGGIWFSNFPGLAAAAMALACRARIAIGYLLLVVAGALTISHQVRSPERNSPLIPDVAWAFAFSLVFVAATSMARRTAQILDSTRRDAYRAAAQGADAQARADERNRFAALTHDTVMASLLVAARRGAAPELASEASAALAALDAPTGGTEGVTISPETMVHGIRAAVALVEPAQITTADVDDSGSVPQQVATAMAGAAAEAVRNTRRHAGAGAHVSVDVRVDSSGVQVVVADDGVGFDPDQVPSSRLGIAVSIRRRMEALNGGSAQLLSAPGAGTIVVLEWGR